MADDIFNVDANPRNADWLKFNWDIIGVDDLESLKVWLKDNGITVDQFKALPIYRFNLEKLPWLKEL